LHIVYDRLFVINNGDVFACCKFGGAEERVEIDGGDNVNVLYLLADIVCKLAHGGSCSCVPSSSWKILSDVHPIRMRGAVAVPTLEVAALSATIDRMERLRTPCLIFFLRVVVSFTWLTHLGGLLFSCSLTWQSSGAVLDKIE
jgi:hypothetical protein